MRGIFTQKITFPPKPDRHPYRRTDISVYRVASLNSEFNPKLFTLTDNFADFKSDTVLYKICEMISNNETTNIQCPTL